MPVAALCGALVYRGTLGLVPVPEYGFLEREALSALERVTIHDAAIEVQAARSERICHVRDLLGRKQQRIRNPRRCRLTWQLNSAVS
jgi:hypothetical protein